MRLLKMLLAVVLMAGAVGMAIGQTETAPTPAPTPKPIRLRGECARMAKECNCTQEQQAQLAEKDQIRRDVLQVWDLENGTKLKVAELEAKLATAEDKAAIEAEVNALKADRAKVKAKADADVLAVLTPEQQAIWEGYKMCKDMTAKHPGMDADQAAKCRTLCNDAAKEIGALQGTPKEVETARAAVMEKLNKAVEELVKPAEEKVAPAEAPVKG